jgi:transcription elongation factor Elf1
MTLSDVAEMRLDCPMCNAENVAFYINLDQTIHCPECDESESIDDFRDRINAYANWVAVLNWLEGKDKKEDPNLPPPLCLSRRDLAILTTVVRYVAGSSEGLSDLVKSFLRTENDSVLVFELPNRETATVKTPTNEEIAGLDKLLCRLLADMIAPGKI